MLTILRVYIPSFIMFHVLEIVQICQQGLEMAVITLEALFCHFNFHKVRHLQLDIPQNVFDISLPFKVSLKVNLVY